MVAERDLDEEIDIFLTHNDPLELPTVPQSQPQPTIDSNIDSNGSGNVNSNIAGNVNSNVDGNVYVKKRCFCSHH